MFPLMLVMTDLQLFELVVIDMCLLALLATSGEIVNEIRELVLDSGGSTTIHLEDEIESIWTECLFLPM